MLIRLAESKDVPVVMGIVARCVRDLLAQGIDQWDEVYPDEETLREDVQSGSLFVAEQEGKIVGAVALNDEQPEQYRAVPWRCHDDRALVVHRLCVDPDHQRHGIGRRIMEFAETQARRHGFRSIRLEVYPTAAAAVTLYVRLGYIRVGEVRFPRRRLAFDCMELLLPEKSGPSRAPEPKLLPATPPAGQGGMPAGGGG